MWINKSMLNIVEESLELLLTKKDEELLRYTKNFTRSEQMPITTSLSKEIQEIEFLLTKLRKG